MLLISLKARTCLRLLLLNNLIESSLVMVMLEWACKTQVMLLMHGLNSTTQL
uniref:Uncharacterized protein n=1 Tax=uncultured marine virus TaxID=186617 RepID=A0A0F7LB85_9VIRU|nr:hypothetical protein [uncultured marine virus]